MTPLNIALLQSENFPKEDINSIKQFLNNIMPNIMCEAYTINRENKYSESKWDAEILAHISQQPIVLRSSLKNFFNTAFPLDQILSRCIGAHTCIQSYLSPASFQFFVVSSVSGGMLSPIVESQPHEQVSSHAAMELALTQKNIHCVHTIDKDTCTSLVPLYPKVKVISLHFSDAIAQIFKTPDIFQVIYTSPIVASFIYELMQNLYSEKLATAFIEVGNKTTIFSFPSCKDACSALLAMASLVRYAGHTKSSEDMESALVSNWIPFKKHSLVWATDKVNQIISPSLADGIVSQLSRNYYDLSLKKLIILGFDVLFVSRLSVHELGISLEEISSQYPFYLEGISHNCIQLYPLSPMLPHLDFSLYCRFLAREKPLNLADIGLFVHKLSVIYPWLQVALLYEANGKKNFSSFVSFN
jgi:hypothetical protein